MIFECWDSSGSGVSAAIQASSHAEAAALFVGKTRGKIGKTGLIFVVSNEVQDYQVFYADVLEAALAQAGSAQPPDPKPTKEAKKGFLRLVKG